MRKHLKVTSMLASVLLLGFTILLSCSKDDGSVSVIEQEALVVTLSSTEIKEGETVQFSATANGKAISGATYYVNGISIDHSEHTFAEPGNYKVVAKKEGYQDSDQHGILVLKRKMAIVVHIVGEEINSNGTYVAKYWKNGTPTILGNNAIGTSLVLANNDVHISGVNGSFSQLIYWKNGLEIKRITNAGISLGKSIAVSDDNVYLSGFQLDSKGRRLATYWKNGQAIALTDANSPLSSQASSIFVSGEDVHIAGVEQGNQGLQRAMYWKNGNAILLNPGGGMSSVLNMFVSGEDVYIAGSEINAQDDQVGTYWKKNQHTISSKSLGATELTSVFISGTDIYVGGYEIVNGKAAAKYWKNGQAVTLTDGSTNAVVMALFVLGADVYVAGYEANANDVPVAKYWKNGVAVDLTDGNHEGAAYDIVVQEVEIE
ncbi:hypothetical protein KCTC52924_00951 [Arenibacter antarcticus]|uniref:PEGA domain-containing protein n=1 Tax=Arenibacter antarcticus TaxID=2040469 RepID=A0ABW5VAX1_9FLAO|nr:hypothetical protein [Arenibacter sp. H213]MCM4167550.1 hypothetical protein [Arenibacter sp. H213]